MERSKISWYKKTEKNQETPLTIYITEIENGVFLILSDKEARLGTIAIGLPSPQGKTRVSTSSMPIVFGIRNDLLTRAVAERIAHHSQKIVIASTYLSQQSPDLAQRCLRFAEEAIREFKSRE